MKINLDFQIYDSRDPNTFIVLDNSYWGQIEREPAIIEVILPGETKPITQYYAKSQVNILDSISLALSCGDCGTEKIELPDGVYEITIKGSPDTFNKTRQYLRTTKFDNELDNLFIKLSLECTKDDKELKKLTNNIDHIELLKKAAEANIRQGNTCVGQELFFKAQDLLKKSKKCNTCK